MKYLVRVVAPHFVAGLDFEGRVCVFSAPILRWAVGKDCLYLAQYFQRKGWQASVIWVEEE